LAVHTFHPPTRRCDLLWVDVNNPPPSPQEEVDLESFGTKKGTPLKGAFC
jgi:hypothetical protein